MIDRTLTENSWDPAWEELFRSREWGRYPNEHLIRFVARNFYCAPNRSQVHVLDLGCGQGPNTWYMAREGFSVSGIDGSPSAVAQARDRLQGEDLRADLRVGDYLILPWQDEVFDAVVDIASLYANRAENFKQALHEVRRVLKPGGLVFSISFSKNSWGYGLGRELEPDGFTDTPEGPAAGRGFSLYLDRERLQEFFSGFDDLTVDKASWTSEGMKHMIEQWLVSCRRPRSA
jgi:ubiquinone/menaquinone biosynthesis C-methylase UbiE